MAREVSALLNGTGGQIVVGVSAEGRVLGVPDVEAAAAQLRRYLVAHVAPPAPWAVRVRPVAGAPCLVVDVPLGPNAPYVADGGIYVRRGAVTVAASRRVVAALAGAHRPHARDWERQPVPGGDIAELDLEELARAAVELGNTAGSHPAWYAYGTAGLHVAAPVPGLAPALLPAVLRTDWVRRWRADVRPGGPEDRGAEGSREEGGDAQPTARGPAEHAAEHAAEQILEHLGLARDGQLHASAVVLFGREPARRYPQTRVRLARFADGDGRLAEHAVCDGHLFALVHQVLHFVEVHLPTRVRAVTPATGGGGESPPGSAPAVPMAAVREGVVNALAHRDYAARDGGVTVTLHPDRLEIWNAGALPRGLDAAALPSVGVVRPPNPDIAHVLRRRGLAEGMGTGAYRITAACRAAGLAAPVWEQVGGGVRLTLWHTDGTPADARTTSVVDAPTAGDPARPEARSAWRLFEHAGAAYSPAYESVRPPYDRLPERAAAYLRSLAPGASTSGRDYREQFAAGVSDRQARLDLAQMVAGGYLDRQGTARGTTYVRTRRPVE